MDIWVVCDVYESEYEFSTHLTERGALLKVCESILCFVNLSAANALDPEKALEGWKEVLNDYSMKGEEWENFAIANWREQDKEQLWKFYDFISEFTWESSSCDFTIGRTSVKP